jgi:ribosomal-protein-alanine N-acetyltransferase
LDLVIAPDARIATGPATYLRLPHPSDTDAVVALASRSIAFHRGLVSPPRTGAEFSKYLQRCERPDLLALFVLRREDDTLLGAIEFSQIILGPFQSAYLGYFLGAPFTGRGYMTEALGLGLRHAFHGIRLHRVEANVQPANTSSIRLLRRLGFKKEGLSRRYLKIGGRWRDHERWALLAEDCRGRTWAWTSPRT